MMLEGKTPLGRWLELVIALFILLSVTQAILTTVDWVIASKIIATVFDVFEVVAVAVFTIEYLARLYAAPESTDYNGDTDAISRLKHIVSFYALIDAVAIFPYYVCLVVHSDIDNYLRLLRLLRLLKLDKYAPGVTLIDDVFRVKKRSLLIAAYCPPHSVAQNILGCNH